jgi:hypothetical protein
MSHILENKCSKSQQQRWAEQGDRKSRAKTTGTRVWAMKWCFLGRDSGVAGGRISGGPGGPHHAMTRPSLDRATMWCGGMVGPPGVSQVPLCPIFEVKIFFKKYGIFRETLFLRIFRNWQMIKNTGKWLWTDGKQIQTKSTTALRYSNMQLNSGNKSE